MSDTSEIRVSRARSKPFEIYVATSAITFLVSYVATYVYSFYLQKMTFDSQFHPGADFPGSFVNPEKYDPSRFNVGVHFFGDFWSTLLRSANTSPYRNVEDLGSSSYPPFAHLLLRPLTWVPYPLALLTFIAVCSLAVLVPAHQRGRDTSNTWSATALTLGYVLTYPFLFALDRGNNVLLAVGCTLLAFQALEKNKKTHAAVWIGLAAAIKIYPLFLFVLLLKRNSFRALVIGLCTFTGVSLVAMVLIGDNLIADWKQFYGNIFGLSSVAGPGQIHLNHSLHGFLTLLVDHRVLAISDLSSVLLSHYNFVSMLTIGVCSAVIVLRAHKSLSLTVCITSVVLVLFVPVTYGYTLSYFLAVPFMLQQSTENSRYVKAVAFVLPVLLASKGMSLGKPNAQLFNYINVPLMLLLLLISLTGLLRRECTEVRKISL